MLPAIALKLGSKSLLLNAPKMDSNSAFSANETNGNSFSYGVMMNIFSNKQAVSEILEILNNENEVAPNEDSRRLIQSICDKLSFQVQNWEKLHGNSNEIDQSQDLTKEELLFFYESLQFSSIIPTGQDIQEKEIEKVTAYQQFVMSQNKQNAKSSLTSPKSLNVRFDFKQGFRIFSSTEKNSNTNPKSTTTIVNSKTFQRKSNLAINVTPDLFPSTTKDNRSPSSFTTDNSPSNLSSNATPKNQDATSKLSEKINDLSSKNMFLDRKLEELASKVLFSSFFFMIFHLFFLTKRKFFFFSKRRLDWTQKTQNYLPKMQNFR